MVHCLRHVLRKHKLDVVFFMETKLDVRRMEVVQRRCGFSFGLEVGADGSKEGLCIAWKEVVSISLRKFSSNFIDV